MRLGFDAKIAPCSEFQRDAVRSACDVADSVGTWRESLAPRCWVRKGKGAQVQLDHDGQVVGEVEFVIDHGGWHIAQCVAEGDEAMLERIRPGQPVSIDAHSEEMDNDFHLFIRRHHIVRLNHLAILRDRDVPGYKDAKIISVRPLASNAKASSGGDWRSQLPSDWQWARDEKWDLKPGTTLLDGGQGNHGTSGWLWTGEKFVRSAAARLAA